MEEQEEKAVSKAAFGALLASQKFRLLWHSALGGLGHMRSERPAWCSPPPEPLVAAAPALLLQPPMKRTVDGVEVEGELPRLVVVDLCHQQDVHRASIQPHGWVWGVRVWGVG